LKWILSIQTKLGDDNFLFVNDLKFSLNILFDFT